MFSKAILAALAFGVANALPTASSSSSSPAPTDNSALIASLKTDASAAHRFQQLLSNRGQPLDPADLAARTVFDFVKNKSPPVPGTAGGSLSSARPGNFPILTDGGLSLNMLTLGPCGLFSPHIHPRANEFFLAMTGTIAFGFILEATVFGNLVAPNPTISGILKPQQGTLFPQGSTHWQINVSPDCGNATTFEAFSSDDEGAILVLNKVSNDSRIIFPEMGGDDLDGLRSVLPPAILSQIDSCRKRCNL